MMPDIDLSHLLAPDADPEPATGQTDYLRGAVWVAIALVSPVASALALGALAGCAAVGFRWVAGA